MWILSRAFRVIDKDRTLGHRLYYSEALHSLRWAFLIIYLGFCRVYSHSLFIGKLPFASSEPNPGSSSFFSFFTIRVWTRTLPLLCMNFES